LSFSAFWLGRKSISMLAWPQVNLDAVPDITTNQISINTETGGMSPEEVEKLVTFPIETAMGGIPGVEQVRSLSQFGLSQVNVVFRDDKDIYFARQLVSERLNGVKDELPDGVGSPTMGPVSTGLGDIYMYAIESPDRTPAQLRELQDWVIAPQLRTVPGVAEVNATDGSVKQYQVVVSPQAMLARSVSVDDVVAALQNNNENAGGGLLERNGERVLIRSVGLAQTTSDIEQIVVKSEDDCGQVRGWGARFDPRCGKCGTGSSGADRDLDERRQGEPYGHRDDAQGREWSNRCQRRQRADRRDQRSTPERRYANNHLRPG